MWNMWNYPKLSKEDKLIIEAAKSIGWKKIPFSILRITRATTIHGSDLGEWWVSQSSGSVAFRVTDQDLKVYLRDKQISKLGL